jgi:hypothetical protein
MSAVTDSLYVVPLKNVSTLCTVERGRLLPHSPIPAPPEARCVISSGGWLAWAEVGCGRIGRAHVDAEPHEQRFPPVSLPDDYDAGCLAFLEEVLFVGGRCGEEAAGWLDFLEHAPAWNSLPIPDECRSYGKRIDDFLVDGTRLVAVDDIVLPKYLLVYDVADPRRPGLRQVKEIPWHTTYEHVRRAERGTRWFALLSEGVNHGRCSAFVAVFRLDTLEEAWVVSTTRKGSFGRRTAQTRDWRDVSWSGDVLLVAAGADGLGVADFSAIAPDALPTEPQRSGSHETARARQQYREFENSPIAYHNLTQGRPVVRVTGVRQSPHALLTVEDGGELDTVLVEIPGVAPTPS